MGTTLTGTTPQDTYDSLIKVTDNGPLSGTLKALSDGLGNDSALALSTGAASVTGTLAVSSSVTAATATLTSPNVFLTNNAATTSEKQIIIANTGGSTRVGIESSAGGAIQIGTEPYAAVFGNQSNNPTQFTTNGTARMTITGAGNVGIGTSAPAVKLDVAGDTTGFFAGGAIQIKDAAATGNSVALGHYSHIIGGGGTTNAALSNAGAGYFSFHTNGAERIRLLAAGGLTFNGDTAAANALDDYEEGTWTPSVAFGGASVGVVLSVANGATYTKIGRQVTVNGFFAITSKGSSTGAATITGLPFTIGNGAQFYAAASLFTESISFVNVLQGRGDNNTTTIQLFEVTEAGVLTTITNADFTDTSNINLSLTYFV